MIKAIRGTRDLLPPDTALWNFVEKTVREVFASYNFHEIRTPIFESTELFARGVGEETDIVAKEMYTWEDRARSGREWMLELLENVRDSLGGSTSDALKYISTSKAQIEAEKWKGQSLTLRP